MIGSDVQEVKRKVSGILRVLDDSSEPLGARIIARRLASQGIELGERAVRYHLKIMDERGLTRLVSRDGRVVTDRGIEELKSALVGDKVGFAISRIENLAFRTDFNLDTQKGLVPVNISFFPEDKFVEALGIMKRVFNKGLGVSNLVASFKEGDRVGETIVPKGKAALATVCSIVVNGTLLKAGLPMDSRFGGILEMKDRKPRRFVELIHYAGSSVDPSEVFIRARMTSVAQVAATGAGKMLANYREIPAICLPVLKDVIARLEKAGIDGVIAIGNPSEPVCEVPIELNRLGIVLAGGLNPVAAVEEAGIEVESHAMSGVLDYKKLVQFNYLLADYQ